MRSINLAVNPYEIPYRSSVRKSAIESGKPVQNIDLAALKRELTVQKQVLHEEHRELGEYVLERRFILNFAETGDGIVRDNAAFVEDKNFVTDLFDYFNDMRAVEDHLAAPGEGAKKTAENHGGVHIETRERFVEDKDLGIMERPFPAWKLNITKDEAISQIALSNFLKVPATIADTANAAVLIGSDQSDLAGRLDCRCRIHHGNGG